MLFGNSNKNEDKPMGLLARLMKEQQDASGERLPFRDGEEERQEEEQLPLHAQNKGATIVSPRNTEIEFPDEYSDEFVDQLAEISPFKSPFKPRGGAQVPSRRPSAAPASNSKPSVEPSVEHSVAPASVSSSETSPAASSFSASHPDFLAAPREAH